MTDNRQAVIGFINDNFNMNAITLEEMPMFPEGVRVIDAEGGQMIVYYDLLYNRVDYKFPDKEVRG